MNETNIDWYFFNVNVFINSFRIKVVPDSPAYVQKCFIF